MGKGEEERKSNEKDSESGAPKIFRSNRRTDEKVLWEFIRERKEKICSIRSREIGVWWTKIYLWPTGMQSNDAAGRKRRTLVWIINRRSKGKKVRRRKEKDQRKDRRD